MAMAMRASVTVSMSEEMMGIWSRRPSARVVARSVSFGRISEWSVASETSSKVSAFGRLAAKKRSAGR
jgi:hypothetical protein